jgi:hypothetical protein
MAMLTLLQVVIPAQAGTQGLHTAVLMPALGARFRGHDDV